MAFIVLLIKADTADKKSRIRYGRFGLWVLQEENSQLVEATAHRGPEIKITTLGMTILVGQVL